MLLRGETNWIPGNAAGPGGGALPQLYEGALKVLRHRVQPSTQVRADVLGCAAQLGKGRGGDGPIFTVVTLLENFRPYSHVIRGIFFYFFFFYVRCSTLLHLPPLRFHCVDAGIEPRTVATFVHGNEREATLF